MSPRLRVFRLDHDVASCLPLRAALRNWLGLGPVVSAPQPRHQSRPAPPGTSSRAMEAGTRVRPARRTAPSKGVALPGNQRCSSTISALRRLRPRPAAGTQQPRHGQVGARHTRGTPPGGGDPNGHAGRHGRPPALVERFTTGIGAPKQVAPGSHATPEPGGKIQRLRPLHRLRVHGNPSR
ncbi:hypothetical protein NDU88_005429 [Pleurodeles waltl]|uniref:Uncharacterized protein n=1 Tax=Pleurodeles waltl TaxID=8319 RepID=A0AAV7QIA0_PLEWA|nr:hypothetical protein NDU88_005429 [Pleurodeles waltl]